MYGMRMANIWQSWVKSTTRKQEGTEEPKDAHVSVTGTNTWCGASAKNTFCFLVKQKKLHHTLGFTATVLVIEPHFWRQKWPCLDSGMQRFLLTVASLVSKLRIQTVWMHSKDKDTCFSVKNTNKILDFHSLKNAAQSCKAGRKSSLQVPATCGNIC